MHATLLVDPYEAAVRDFGHRLLDLHSLTADERKCMIAQGGQVQPLAQLIERYSDDPVDSLLDFLDALGFCGPQAGAAERTAWSSANESPEGDSSPAERALRRLHQHLVLDGTAGALDRGSYPVALVSLHLARLLCTLEWTESVDLSP